MGQQYNRFLRFLYFSGDLIFINTAFFLSFYIRFGNPSLIFTEETYFRPLYYPLFLVFNLSWTLLSLSFNFYKPLRNTETRQLIWRIARIFLLHLAIMTVYFILAEREDFSRQFFFVTFMMYFIFLAFWRVAVHFIFRIAQKRGFNQRKVIIVGYGEVGKELHDFFNNSPELGILSKGFFDDKNGSDLVIGRLDDLEKYLIENRIDEVYCALPDVLPDRIESINVFCEQHLIKFNLIPDFRSFYYKRVQLSFFDNIPILVTLSDPLSDPFNRIYKRTFDIVFSLLVITLFLSWFMPLMALIIKLGSKGPVFFVQQRPGFRNNKFKVYKFRSMVVNELSDDIQATKDDMRVTGIGKFLRKTSLDELPQFFNVLKGDMSVVGPRPHMLFQTELYSPMIDSYMLRHFVKPGITGLAQVNGYRGETSDPALMKTRIRFDRIYIERWSPWLDIKIIILTTLIAFKPQDYAY